MSCKYRSYLVFDITNAFLKYVTSINRWYAKICHPILHQLLIRLTCLLCSCTPEAWPHRKEKRETDLLLDLERPRPRPAPSSS